jgi:pre-mRNA-processing factor 19
LIEAYIAENHKDPVNGEDLEVTDLIDLKSSRIVTPRPPTLTSIPSLLSTFQNEWDALALETFNIRQQLHQTRQELTTALYQHDAAIRVIARLTKERDEARDALSKVTISTGGGDAMQIDNQGLPDALAAKVDATQERYSQMCTGRCEISNANLLQ